MPTSQQPQQDSFGTAIGSFLKSVGSGVGRAVAGAVSGGKTEDLYLKKQQQTQALLHESIAKRAALGEPPTSDDWKAWSAAGGDPSVVAAETRDAVSRHTRVAQSLSDIDALEKGGLLEKKTAALYRLALHSQDPTVSALVQSAITSQAQLASTFLRTQATLGAAQTRANAERDASHEQAQARLGAANISAGTRRETAHEQAQARLGAATTSKEGRVEAARISAKSRTDEAAVKEQHAEEKEKRAEEAARDKDFLAATSSAGNAVKTINTYKGPEGHPMQLTEAVGIAKAANMNTFAHKSMAFHDVLSKGVFIVPRADDNTYGTAVAGFQNLPDALGLSPQTAEAFHTEIQAAIKAAKSGDKNGTLQALSAALATIPSANRIFIREQLAAIFMTAPAPASRATTPAQ